MYDADTLEKLSGIKNLSTIGKLIVDIRYSLTGHTVKDFLFFLLVFYSVCKAMENKNRRAWKLSLLPAVLFAIFMLIGNAFKFTGGILLLAAGKRSALKCAVFFMGCFFAFFLGISFLLSWQDAYRKNFFQNKLPRNGNDRRKIMLVNFGLLLLMWMPYWIAYFSGLTNSDFWDALGAFYGYKTHSVTMTERIREGVTLNTNNPMLYTLVAVFQHKISDFFGHPYVGLVLYDYGQMLCFALILSWCISELAACGANKAVCTILLLFYGLLPIHPNFALTTIKDTLFAMAFLIYVVLLHRWITNPEFSAKNKGWCIRFALVHFFYCAFGIMASICYSSQT